MPVLVEREHVMGQLAAAVEGACSTRGTSLFLVGDAGLGKTTLLNEACLMAESRGVEVRRFTCSELDAVLPFGVVDRLFGDIGSTRIRAPAAFGSAADAIASRYGLLVEWFSREGGEPLLFVVDDLHWADPDSLNLLAALGRRFDGWGVVLLAGLRPWPQAALTRARMLVGDGAASLEHICPLTEAGSAAVLMEQVGSDLDAGSAGRAHAASGGNPLLLLEVAEAWKRGDDLTAGIGSLAERAFLPRFAGVGAGALRWARAASVFGTTFHPPHVDLLLGVDGAASIALLEALCEAGVMRGIPGGDAEFVHPLVRQALYEDMALPVRRGLHARVFHLLRSRGAPLAAVAFHAVAAEMKDDSGAMETVLAAARQAFAAGAVVAAAECFRSAISLAPEAIDPGVWLEYGQACLAAGWVEQAEAAVGRFLDSGVGEGIRRVAAMRLMAQVENAAGRFGASEKRSEEAASLAASIEPRRSVEILLDSTFVSWRYIGPVSARRVTRRALAALEEFGIQDELLRAAAFTADTSVACIEGDISGFRQLELLALSAIEHARQGEIRSPWAWDSPFAFANLAKILERFDECKAAFAVLADIARTQGAEVTFCSYVVNQADVLWRIGRLQEAYDLLADGAALGGMIPGLTPFASIGMAFLSHQLGEFEERSRWMSRLEAMLPGEGDRPFLRLWYYYIRCSEALDQGRVTEAAGFADRLHELSERSGVREPCVVPWHAAAVEAYLSAGRIDDLKQMADELEKVCSLLPCRAPRAVGLAGRAGVEWQLGRLDSADALYRQALQHNEAVSMPLAHAETLISYGRFLRHRGDAPAARKVLQRALEVLEPTGARRLAGLASEELAVAGGRPRRRVRWPAELTPQERRVAALASQGLTNQEIARRLYVSAKTVDHHLSSVYAKLEVHSRRALILAWSERAGPDSRP